jgi:hypothetical protein
LVLYSVFLFFGLYHVLLFIYRRNDRYNLYFSALLVGMAFYFFARANLGGIADARWMAMAVGAAVLFVVWDMLDTFYFHTNMRFLEFAISFLALALVAILAGRFVSLHGESERFNLQLAKQKDSFYRFEPTEFLKPLQKKTSPTPSWHYFAANPTTESGRAAPCW